jgi:hypothetical protein
MLSEFSQIDDLDKPIRDAAVRPGPVRMRVQPMIMAPNGQYRSWRGVSWTMVCESAAEALAARDALRTFFETLTRCGPQQVTRRLQAMPTTTTTTTTKTKKEGRRV